MRQNGHIGVPALHAERTKLLTEYDTAVKQAKDDPVKTEHGVFCEAHFRSFLEQFLPKKYGITKGYIITPDLDYAGPMEEWDIIIYDAMESPVLFVRQNRDEKDKAGKRGIPVEYVRAVIEVKATFNKSMADKVTQKLLKLRQFIKPSSADEKNKNCLPALFRAFAVFVETKVKNSKEYKKALGALAPFWQNDPLTQFSEALIIRAESYPDYSASIAPWLVGDDSIIKLLAPYCEVSDSFNSFVKGMNVFVVSGGYGENEFWRFLINMVHALNGEDLDVPGVEPSGLTGGYGDKIQDSGNVRLFPD